MRPGTAKPHRKTGFHACPARKHKTHKTSRVHQSKASGPQNPHGKPTAIKRAVPEHLNPHNRITLYAPLLDRDSENPENGRGATLFFISLQFTSDSMKEHLNHRPDPQNELKHVPSWVPGPFSPAGPGATLFFMFLSINFNYVCH